MPPKNPSASIDVVAALFAEHQKQMDQRHGENKSALDKIFSKLDDVLDEQKETNGRVTDHERRIHHIEMRPDRRVQSQRTSFDIGEWKVVGSGIGIVLFTIWGVVGAIHWCFDLLAKIGSTVTGK
jgi:uncharacterized protein YlxW (UPF0749 family)